MPAEDFQFLAILALLLHWLLVIGLSVRVIMRRRPVGILLAWLALILSVPVLGVLAYLVIGENRISGKYVKRARAIEERYRQWQQSLHRHAAAAPDPHADSASPLVRLGETIFGFPLLQGNRLQLLTDSGTIFRLLIGDIQRSSSTCHLEFYIWHPGGLADAVLEAVADAARRGVACRILVDSVGSKDFLASNAPGRLQAAGVQLGMALPVGIFSSVFSRADLRNHRKIAIIDGAIAYTGSQNLVDPADFKQDAGVGRWVDAMLRIEGPTVESLGGVFLQDWEVCTGQGLETLEGSHDVAPVARQGEAAVQVMPSGPVRRPLAILQALLSVFYAARTELVITTPYFVPDESVLTALLSAAQRGVAVTVVLPEKNDSMLVDYASSAVFDELLAAGVQIAAFRGGLLHTKSITVDGKFCLFGSVNIDMRSLWLNFEISLLICNRQVTGQIRELQAGYLRDSRLLDAAEWRRRPFHRRFLENLFHLAAPLL